MLLGLVVALPTISMSLQAHAQEVSLSADRAKPMITLRTYNYGVSNTLLRRSENEANAILNHAGLDVGWIDCPLSADDSASYPTCLSTMGSADFTIKILTAAEAQRIAMKREAMGEALECTGNRSGCSAYIFYRDVRELATNGDVSEFQLLGHALAHEIGHLLLGARSHSATGIMRAHWHQQELYTMARAHLFFTDQQSERMRAEVSELTADQQNQTQNADPERSQEAFNSTDGQKK